MKAAPKPRRFDFYPDDWLSGTRELDEAARGVYITACALIYSRGGPIKHEVLRAFCPGDLRVYRRSLEALVRLGKLDDRAGYLSNKRCIKELKLASKRVVTAVKNVRKRWAKTKQIKVVADTAVILPSPSPSPSPSPEGKNPDAGASGARARDSKYAWPADAEVPPSWVGETYRERPKVNGFKANLAFVEYWTVGKGKGTKRTERGWRQAWRNWIAKERDSPDTSWVQHYDHDREFWQFRDAAE